MSVDKIESSKRVYKRFFTVFQSIWKIDKKIPVLEPHF